MNYDKNNYTGDDDGGTMAEYYSQHNYNYNIDIFRDKPKVMCTPSYLKIQDIKRLYKNKIWVTANGTQIAVKDMTDQHIENTLKCLRNKGVSHIPAGYMGGKLKWINILQGEIDKRTKE